MRFGNRAGRVRHLGVAGMARLAAAFLLALSGLFGSLSSVAADASPEAELCMRGGAAPLPGMRYRCPTLSSGRRVLIGEAGSVEAPALLLIHGLGDGAHRDWAPVLEPLARRYRVVVLDLPGFGASEVLAGGYSFGGLAAAIAEALDQVGIARTRVVGHSLGGAVSLYFAHAYPSRVEGLVLADAAGILHKTAYARHVARVGLPQAGFGPLEGLFGGIERHLNGWSRAVLRWVEDGPDFTRFIYDSPRLRARLFGSNTQLDAALGLIEHDFTRVIREMATPTTLIWGRDDPVAPLRTGQLLAARLPQAQLRIIDGVGHVPMSESPTRFLELLLPALDSSSRSQPEAPPADLSFGAATCKDRNGAVYSGHYDSLTLVDCHNVRIENARLGRLVASSSSAQLTGVVIHGEEFAVSAVDSHLVGTAVELRARRALVISGGEVDLAGAKLTASERAVEMSGGGRLIFSVSELQAPDFSGDAHFVWPGRAGRQ